MMLQRLISFLLSLIVLFSGASVGADQGPATGAVANRTQASAVTLNQALNMPGGTLEFTNDTVNPWVVDSTTFPDRVCGATNTMGRSNTETTIRLYRAQIPANTVLTFDWKVSSEATRDIGYFIVGQTSGSGTPIHTISGLTNDWKTIKYVIPTTGNYYFWWKYIKDSAVHSGEDRLWVDNVAFEEFSYVESVVVTPPEVSVNINYTKQLTATVYPENATIQDLTWTSADNNIATVDGKGLVTGITQGTTYIIATSVEGFIAGESRVTVLPPVPVTGIELDYTQGTLMVGDRGQLTATLLPAFTTNRTVLWSTNNAAVATVSNAGLVTAKAPGTATISAVSQDGAFLATCAVTVIPDENMPDQTQIPYTPLSVGSSVAFKLGWNESSYIRYERGALIETTTAKGYNVNLEAGKKITFETTGTTDVDTYMDLYDAAFNRVAYDDDSGTRSFAAINSFMVPQTGTYYLLVSGYELASKGNVTLSITEVPPIPVTGVQFGTATATVPLDYTMPLNYNVLPLNADVQDVSFVSSNPDKIAVNQNGEVTGISPGSAVITVTTVQGGFTATCLVSVGYTAVESFSFDTDAVLIGLNKTKKPAYTLLPTDAQIRDITFVSSNPAVASVSSEGMITAHTLGSAVITATTADGGFTDTCSVRVVEVSMSTSAMVTLVAGDVWGDGTGYQMLLDADADAYGRLFQKSGHLNQSGDAPPSIYNQFEYKIPENADGVLTTSNIVFNSSQTILIPAGVYDFCITNPFPGDRVWIANTTFTSPGRFDNFHFEAGFSYTFVVDKNPIVNRDRVTLTAQYTGAGLSSYTVGFDAGTGGGFTGKTQLLVEEEYILTAEDLPVPAPQPGFKFVGWSVNPVGTQITSNITFTANFAVTTYTVIFRNWNNDVLKVQENVPYGTAATPPANPTRTNYQFVGWDTDFSFVSSNLTVRPVFVLNSYPITLPIHDGYVITPIGTSVSPTPHGGNFTFKVELTPNYNQSVITVTQNGNPIYPVAGEYTIPNITQPVTVAITGVVLNPADYTQLDAAIALVPMHPDAYYTQSTITAFRDSVAAGQVLARNLTVLSQGEVDAAAAAIQTAYNELVLKPADYTALDSALALVPVYPAVYYTPQSLAAFHTALEAGEAIPRDYLITNQTPVDNAANAIEQAYNNLALHPDPTGLILKQDSLLTIQTQANTITGFDVSANTVANILAQFSNPAILTVEDKNDQLLADNDLVGTGAVIRLFDKDGQEVDSVVVVIYGDTDGDGRIDGNDIIFAVLIAAGFLTVDDVGAAICAAADVNKDGVVDELDAQLLEQAGLFLADIEQ